jgi:DegV family protein with EDD domain
VSGVAVVTDSNICLPPDLVQGLPICLVPLQLIIEGRTYLDGIDLGPGDFYDLLRKAKKLPTTSAPAPGAYLQAFAEMAPKSDGLLCITIAPHLSAAHNSALEAVELAREALPQTQIEVVNSQTAAGAQGLIVLEAARAAARGLSLSEVAQAARDMVSRVTILALLDTLHYLAKGGRIPKAAAWAASLIQLKPLIEVSPSRGEVSLLERTRTKARGVERLRQIMADRAGDRPVHVIVLHADAPEEAGKLKEQVSSEFQCSELYVSEFTPTMGAHAGPGMLGLAFYAED